MSPQLTWLPPRSLNHRYERYRIGGIPSRFVLLQDGTSHGFSWSVPTHTDVPTGVTYEGGVFAFSLGRIVNDAVQPVCVGWLASVFSVAAQEIRYLGKEPGLEKGHPHEGLRVIPVPAR